MTDELVPEIGFSLKKELEQDFKELVEKYVNKVKILNKEVLPCTMDLRWNFTTYDDWLQAHVE